MVADVDPIITQVSRPAAAAPDATTNRLARAYVELGVAQGDYLSIVLPNSIVSAVRNDVIARSARPRR